MLEFSLRFRILGCCARSEELEYGVTYALQKLLLLIYLAHAFLAGESVLMKRYGVLLLYCRVVTVGNSLTKFGELS